MSRQRDILPEVLSLVQSHVPDCPVYLSGSVSLGDERTDSDIDLVIVVPNVSRVHVPGSEVEWEEDHFKLATVSVQGVPVHLHIASQRLLRDLEEHPWRAYKFLKTEMLHDPNGVVQKTKAKIAPWFENRPDAVRLWQQWLAEHRERQLSQGRQLGPLVKQFPNQVPDFWDHLDRQYGDEIAEPATAADGEDAAAE